jgi:hypothetical protein
MPLRPEGQADDPMIEMSKGVLLAIDEVARLGIADPRRLGLIGHSYGGYGAYSIVTYTHRFQAAVALAGFADLPSDYGEFIPDTRYGDFADERQHMPGLFESGQLRMGDSPLGNLWRYVRNSPVFDADRVTTPLMIIRGDLDYVRSSKARSSSRRCTAKVNPLSSCGTGAKVMCSETRRQTSETCGIGSSIGSTPISAWMREPTHPPAGPARTDLP